MDDYNKAFNTNIHALKDHQVRAIDSLMDGKDCMCCLPTGYGKSLIYELLPFVDKGCLVIVIVPLNAIIEQQLKKLIECSMSLSPGKYDTQMLKNEQLNYIFCHPEQVVNNKTVQAVFSSSEFQKRKVYLVVDEAHCVIEWGESFRTDYKKIYQLRSIFDCQVLALSATVTVEGRQ